MSWLRALRDRLDRLAAANATPEPPSSTAWTATGGPSLDDRMRLAGLPPAPGAEEPPDQTDSVKLRVVIRGGPWGPPGDVD